MINLSFLTRFLKQTVRCRCQALTVLLLLSVSATAQYKDRVYANTQDPKVEAKGSVQLLSALNISLADALQTLGVNLSDLGKVVNPNDAVDTNPFNAPRTASRLSATYLDLSIPLVARVKVGALVSQNLKFASNVNGNVPVTVKLGYGGGLAQTLLDGLSVQATLDGVPVGPVQDKNTGLVGLLGNASVVEFTFKPGVLYNGVKVTLNTEGQILALNTFQSVDVYYAYYNKDVATLANCDQPFDVLSGADATISALGSVSNPWNAIDGNQNTFSSLNSGVSVLPTPTKGVYETIIYPTLSKVGDSAKVIISYPGALLEAQLINSFTIQTINHNDDGTETIVETFGTGGSLLHLELLTGSTTKAALSLKTTQPFNRIKIWYGGVVAALQSVNLYEVSRMASKPVVESPGLNPANNTMDVCAGSPVNLSIKNPESGSVYQWFNTSSGGTAIVTGVSANGTLFTPAGLVAGQNVFYVSVSRNGCSNEASARTKIIINVNPAPKASDIAVSGNGSPVCQGSSIILTPSVVTSPSIPITNPVFNWYKNADKTGPITNGLSEAGVTYSLSNGILTINGLNISTTFYVSVSGNNGTGCENSAAELKPVPVNINRIANDNDITISNNISQCVNTDVVLNPGISSSVLNPVIKWHKDIAKTQLITSGADGALVYLISGNKLTISNLPAGTFNYYVTVQGDNLCENTIPKIITVSVGGTILPPTFVSDKINLCGTGKDATFEINNYAGNGFKVYNGPNPGDTEITTGFTLNNNLLTFSNVSTGAIYWIETNNGGTCTSATRTKIEIGVTPLAPLAAITGLTVNGLPNGDVCADAASGKIILTATSTGLTNPVYYFYESNTLKGSNSTGIFEVTPFVSGTALTYSVGVSSDEYCETDPLNRRSITFTPFSSPANPVLNLSGIQLVKIGVTLALKVDPLSVGAISYQWYKDGSLLTETSATLTITNTKASDAGIYKVLAVGTGGCISVADANVTIKITDNISWKSFVTSSGQKTVKGGENVTYTIHVQNTGSDAVSGYTITDMVPQHTTLVMPIADGGTENSGLITWSGINIPANGTLTRQFTVKVDNNLTNVDQIRNIAYINDGSGPDKPTLPPDPNDPNQPGDPTKTGTDIPVDKITGSTSWKSFSVSGGAKTVKGGEDVTYTIHLQNTGNQDISNASVKDALPANTTFVSAANGGTLTAGTVNWPAMNIPVGQTSTVSFVIKVNTNLTGVDKIANIAYTNDGSGPDKPTLPPDPNDPNLPGDPTKTGTDIPVDKITGSTSWKSFSVVGGAKTVKGGENVTYTIHLQNTGNQDISNASIKDALPANTTFVSAANGGTLTAGTVNWPAMNIPVGQTGTVSFVVKVNANLTGVDKIANIAYINDGSGPDKPTLPPDPNDPNLPGDPTKTGTDIPVDKITGSTSWKSFSVVGGAKTVKGGEDVTYTIHLQNTGNQDISNASIKDALPANTTFVSATNGGTLTAGTVNWPAMNIPVGQTSMVSFVVKVNANLTGVDKIANIAYTNDGSGPDKPTLPPDPNDPDKPGDPTTPGTDIPVLRINDFSTAKVVASSSADGKAHSGDILTYTINITNTGNAALSNVQVTDPVNNRTTFISATNGGTLNGNTVSFTIPLINVGQNISISFQVKVGNDLRGITAISNIATVNGASITKNTNPADITAECTAPQAPAGITGNASLLCAGSPVTLSVSTPDASLIYRWYNQPTGGTMLAEGPSYTTPALSASTTYYVESIAIAGQCSSTTRTTVPITVLQTLSTPLVTVKNTTPNSISFAWDAIAGAQEYEISMDKGLTWQTPASGATSLTHQVTGLKPTQTVSLQVRVKGQLPCQSSPASVSVTGMADNPLGNEVFIPNVFTPNNDGKNDVLQIQGNTIASIKVTIYTQWGQMIFQSSSLQNSWDGTYKGQIQPRGVYVYMAEIEFQDGTKTIKKGNVTLLR